MKFAITGVGGYVARKHLQAIKDLGHEVVAALDPNDSVGILDSYFSECEFFTNYERFDRHLERLAEAGEGIDYLSICSPNWLHDSHCRLALRVGAKAICEKPLVINPANLDLLSGGSPEQINCILQARLHPDIEGLACSVEDEIETDKVREIDLIYYTPRGKWYQRSWKGDEGKSGGIIYNIGIHLLDLLIYSFGECKVIGIGTYSPTTARGVLHFKSANVHWSLSTDPKICIGKTYRQIIEDGITIADLSTGFEDLHTESYRRILEGNGFSIEDARPAIELAWKIKEAARKL